MYTIQEREARNIFTRRRTVSFDVSDAGLIYGNCSTKQEAEIVAHGLNSGFQQHILGGFSDEVVEQIKIDMKRGE